MLARFWSFSGVGNWCLPAANGENRSGDRLASSWRAAPCCESVTKCALSHSPAEAQESKGGISGDAPWPLPLHIRALSQLLPTCARRASPAPSCGFCVRIWPRTGWMVRFGGSVLRGTNGHWRARKPDGFSVNTRVAFAGGGWRIGADGRVSGARLANGGWERRATPHPGEGMRVRETDEIALEGGRSV
jgi:hypothetical protein